MKITGGELEIPKRVFWLDVTRVLAILFVICIHSHEAAGIRAAGTDYLFIKCILFSIDRMGVPLFFMISGALLINKQILAGYHIPWKRIFDFALLMCIWSIVTNFSFVLIHNTTMPITDLLKIVILKYNIFIGGVWGHAPHLWFMPVIIGLYLASPFIAMFVNGITEKEAQEYILVAVILNFILLVIPYNNIFKVINRSFFDYFILYFVIGYIIFKYQLCMMKSNNIFVLRYISLMCCSISILAILVFLKGHFINKLFDTGSSLLIFFNSVSTFLSIKLICCKKECTDDKFTRFIEIVARNSFGMYLSHYIFIYLILFFGSQISMFNSLNLLIKSVIMITLTTTCSFFFTYFMRKFTVLSWLVS
jgi:surface polysaccharide O-acyltransferase-like enzyme